MQPKNEEGEEPYVTYMDIYGLGGSIGNMSGLPNALYYSTEGVMFQFTTQSHGWASGY